jgi:hypothetical protein
VDPKLPTTPNAHGREQDSMGRASCSTDPEDVQAGRDNQKPDAREDWVYVATADPASWLKGVGLWRAVDRRKVTSVRGAGPRKRGSDYSRNGAPRGGGKVTRAF